MSAVASARPWLSVLMPVFNGRDYLAQALDSVVAQADPGIECIVVDGGSDDGTPALAARYADRLNLRLLDKPESPNWVWSTNLALEHASAPFSSILHQDDTWLPGRAAAMREMAESDTQAGFCVHAVRFIGETGRRAGTLTCPWPRYPKRVDSERAVADLLVQNFLSCPAPVFSTALARQVGGMDETLWYTADWDFWLKLLRRTRALYTDHPLAAFRLHATSQTVQQSRDVRAFREQLDLVLERHGHAVASPERRAKVLRAAGFSNTLNASLAARLHGHPVDWAPVLRQGLALGPGGMMCFLRNSRMVSRGLARVRAGLWYRRRRERRTVSQPAGWRE
ncbi:MAG: glycosyltransferase [Alphaproteobacteria bacterium]